MFIKAHAESTGGAGRMVSTPRRATSVQGRLYEAGLRSHLGGSQRGRGVAATYVQPSRRRGR